MSESGYSDIVQPSEDFWNLLRPEIIQTVNDLGLAGSGPFVRPEDFGAIGDGVTDDTEAIQAALDSVAATNLGNGTPFPPFTSGTGDNGGAVLLGVRRFGISAPLVIGGQTTFEGIGYSSEIVALDTFPDGQPMLIVGGPQKAGTIVRGLTLNGRKQSGVEAGGIDWLSHGQFATYIDWAVPMIVGANRDVLENVIVVNMKHDGIILEALTSTLLLQNVLVAMVEGWGIRLLGDDSELIGCQTGGTGLGGYDITGGVNRLQACKAYGAGELGDYSAFNVAGNYNSLDNCEAQQCRGDAFRIAAPGTIVRAGRASGCAGTSLWINASYCDVDIISSDGYGAFLPALVEFGPDTHHHNRINLRSETLGTESQPVIGDPTSNELKINGQDAYLSVLFETPYEPSPYDASDLYMVLTDDLVINNPVKRHAGCRLRFILQQDNVGARTVTFDDEFLLDGFVPNLGVDLTNVIEFMFNGINWIQVDSIIGISATAAPPPPPPEAFSDDFNESDGPLLTPWTLVGSWGRVDGKAIVTASSGNNDWAIVDAGTEDDPTAVDVAAQPGRFMSLVFRYVDSSNCWIVQYEPNDVLLKLWKLEGGGLTGSWEAAETAPGGEPHRYSVEPDGDHIVVKRDGVVKFDIVDAAHQTSTKRGLRTYGGSLVGGYFDNFVIG